MPEPIDQDRKLRPLAVAPFENWLYEDVIREMDLTFDKETHGVRKDYAVDRNHYRKGKEWVGPGTASSTGKIADQFAPDDAIGEVLSNVANAFSEPQIGMAPVEELAEGQTLPADLKVLMEEATALLTVWWTKQRMQEHVQERQFTTAWAGESGLRLWIPWRFLETEDGENVIVHPTTDFTEALSFIHVTAPEPEFARILTDPITQDKVAVLLEDEVMPDPSGKPGQTKTFKRAEIVFLDVNRLVDKDAETVIRYVYSSGQKSPIRTTLKLGGRFLFAEMKAISLLTDPVVRTQRQLNLLTTLVTRIAETAAFRERYITNAKPQGTRITFKEGDKLAVGAFLERDDEGRVWQVVPVARTLGASTTTELVGLPNFDEHGTTKGNLEPSVVIVDPVDPGPYIDAATATRRRIMRMSSQGHLGGTSDAEASGIAYEQARAVFEKDLNKRRIAEEGMLQDLLMSVLAFIESITDRPGHFTNRIRIVIDQHVNAGPRSPDLVRLDIEAHEAGLISRETAMARIGVKDIEAELVRVRNSTNHILSVLEKVVLVGADLTEESLADLLSKLKLPDGLLIEFEDEPEPVPPVVPVVEPTA